MLGLTQEQCSKHAGVSLTSYKRYEQLEDTEMVLNELKYSTVKSIVSFFEEKGIVFTFNYNGAGVALPSTRC